MDKKLEEKIFRRFSTLFPGGRKVDPKQSLMNEGISCGDGWFDLIWNLCERIEKILYQKGNEKLEKNFTVVQVKEKFGSLRFYIHGGNKLIWDIVFEAEKEASNTCEKCGRLGKLDTRFGWYLTLCKECSINREKEHKEKTEKFKNDLQNKQGKDEKDKE